MTMFFFFCFASQYCCVFAWYWLYAVVFYDNQKTVIIACL